MKFGIWLSSLVLEGGGEDTAKAHERNCKNNIKWPSMQRRKCPIHNGTLEPALFDLYSTFKSVSFWWFLYVFRVEEMRMSLFHINDQWKYSFFKTDNTLIYNSYLIRQSYNTGTLLLSLHEGVIWNYAYSQTWIEFDFDWDYSFWNLMFSNEKILKTISQKINFSIVFDFLFIFTNSPL